MFLRGHDDDDRILSGRIFSREFLVTVGLILFFALVFFSLSGCATTSEFECPPPPECPTISEETFACPEPRQLPELIEPRIPERPAQTSEMNSWAADVAESLVALVNILRDRIDALEEIVEQYRHPPE